MTKDTTTTSGAADLPEALRRSTAADGKTELFNLPGYPLMVRAVDFNRLHTESEMRRTALLDEMQKAALAAGQATAAQPGVVYAELPAPNYPKSGGFPGTFAEAQMRAFADATHALRASHGQAPAGAAPSAGAVAGPDDIDAIALTRYKVVPAHESMFHRFAVVAGDGKQQLYLGREVECENMARKFAGAFLDGAFYQANITPSTQAADSVQEDAARYRWLREGNDAKHGAAWHVAVNLYGCEWDAAIDAAMNKGASQ